MTSLSQSSFKDLYLGEGYADVTALAGASVPRSDAPEEWADDIQKLRALCKERHAELGIPEFSLVYDQVLYRVTLLSSLDPSGVYVLRRPDPRIREPRELSISTRIVEAVTGEDIRGLVLVCGDMGTGKTTTAVALAVYRLKRHGGTALGIEDPIETACGGIHGTGRMIPVPASRHSGGYKEHLLLGLRSGADFIFLGEIRDKATAQEAIQASLNGFPIYTTFHGASIESAVERFSSFDPSFKAILADSLSAIIWLERTSEQESNGIRYRFHSKTLLLNGSDQSAIRERIRTGQFHMLASEVARQASVATYGDSYEEF